MSQTTTISGIKQFRDLTTDEDGWVFQIGEPVKVTPADFNGARSGMMVYNARKIGHGRTYVSGDTAVYPTAEECQEAWEEQSEATLQLFASRRAQYAMI